jgi:hypothetical protein
MVGPVMFRFLSPLESPSITARGGRGPKGAGQGWPARDRRGRMPRRVHPDPREKRRAPRRGGSVGAGPRIQITVV